MSVFMVIAFLAGCALTLMLRNHARPEPVGLAPPALAPRALAHREGGDLAFDEGRSPINCVATLMRLIAGDAWPTAREDAAVRLGQVAAQREVAQAVAYADATDPTDAARPATLERLASDLGRRMDRAERACVAQMFRQIGAARPDCAARADHAAGGLLKA